MDIVLILDTVLGSVCVGGGYLWDNNRIMCEVSDLLQIYSYKLIIVYQRLYIVCFFIYMSVWMGLNFYVWMRRKVSQSFHWSHNTWDLMESLGIIRGVQNKCQKPSEPRLSFLKWVSPNVLFRILLDPNSPLFSIPLFLNFLINKKVQFLVDLEFRVL